LVKFRISLKIQHSMAAIGQSEERILQQLEHLVFDEHKLVSLKWATHHFQIGAQVCKQILSKFVDKFQDRLCIKYCVSGYKTVYIEHANAFNSVYVSPSKQNHSHKNTNSRESAKQSACTETHCDVFTVLMVSDSKLQETQNSFDKLVDTHIYSVATNSARQIKDFYQAQYETDLTAMESVQTMHELNRFSNIEYNEVKTLAPTLGTIKLSPNPKSTAKAARNNLAANITSNKNTNTNTNTNSNSNKNKNTGIMLKKTSNEDGLQRAAKKKAKHDAITDFFNKECEQKQKETPKEKEVEKAEQPQQTQSNGDNKDSKKPEKKKKDKKESKKKKKKKKSKKEVKSVQPARKRKRGEMEIESNLVPIEYASESSENSEEENQDQHQEEEEEFDEMVRHSHKRRKLVIGSDDEDEDEEDEDEDMDVDMNANQKTKTKRNAKKLSKKQVKAMEDEKVLEQRKKNFFGANAANSAKKHKKYKRGTRSYIDGNGMFVTEDYKETDDEDEDEDVAVNDQVEQKESNGAKHVQNKENNDKNNHENTSNKKPEKSSKPKKTANNSKKGKNGKNSNGKNGNIMNFFKVK